MDESKQEAVKRTKIYPTKSQSENKQARSMTRGKRNSPNTMPRPGMSKTTSPAKRRSSTPSSKSCSDLMESDALMDRPSKRSATDERKSDTVSTIHNALNDATTCQLLQDVRTGSFTASEISKLFAPAPAAAIVDTDNQNNGLNAVLRSWSHININADTPKKPAGSIGNVGSNEMSATTSSKIVAQVKLSKHQNSSVLLKKRKQQAKLLEKRGRKLLIETDAELEITETSVCSAKKHRTQVKALPIAAPSNDMMETCPRSQETDEDKHADVSDSENKENCYNQTPKMARFQVVHVSEDDINDFMRMGQIYLKDGQMYFTKRMFDLYNL